MLALVDAGQEAGFSIKVSDPQIGRLLHQALERRESPSTRTPVRSTCSPQSRPVRQKRQPLVSWDDVERDFHEALGKARIPLKATESWDAIFVGSRISALEKGHSTSPERQTRNNAEWCVQHKRRPVGLLAEETSGSIYRHTNRKQFEQFYDDIANDRIRDPLSGRVIEGIVYWRYDRFTRLPDEGERWLKLLLQKGINLHATQWNDPPRDLHQIEHDIRRALIDAARETDNTRDRIVDEILRKARRNEPLFCGPLWGRERVFDPKTGKVLRQKAIPKYRRLALQFVQEVLDGKAAYSVMCDLRDRGVTNTLGAPMSLECVTSLLRAPHLAGLTRVRSDRKLLHSPDYQGNLLPTELVYPEGGSPPKGFVPAIDPLIPYPMWEALQQVLDSRAQPRGPRVTHLCSGFFTCEACGDNLVSGKGIYRCTKSALQGRRRTGSKTTVTAADGKRHCSIAKGSLELLIEEILFAAIDTTKVRGEAEDAANRAAQLEEERRHLLDNIQKLSERLANTTYLLSNGDITRSDYKERAAEIRAERDAVEAELRALGKSLAEPKLPVGMTLRKLWPDMDVDTRREWMMLVLEGGSVKPTPAGQSGRPHLSDRVTIKFRKGYRPPMNEVNALFERVDALLRLRANQKQPPSAELSEHIFALTESGLNRATIVSKLENEGWKTPEGRDWTPVRLRYATKLVYAERGLALPPQPQGRVQRYDVETVELMLDIYARRLNWPDTAEEVNRLGIPMLDGSEWTAADLSRIVLAYARRLGWSVPGRRNAKTHAGGRPRYLDSAARDRVWRMHREEGKSLRDVAAWLEGRGVVTARRKANWSPSSILEIVRSVDREKTRQARMRRAA